MTKIEIDHPIADFTAPATSDTQVSNKTLEGKYVIIYFYPKDNTPGCTTEAKNFRDLHAQFSKLNAVIFGVSKDSLASHEKFKTKLDLPFELISDEDKVICKLFDVIKEKNLYGRKYMGIERSTFLIDKKGRLHQEWRKVRVKGHAQTVLDATKSLAAETA